MTDTDVVVIGGGVMGTAAAWALARRGREVTLLEQFELGHKRGSSHGTSRIFRFSYHDPMYVGLAMEALPLWRELERESGRDLLTTTGGLDVGQMVSTHAAALKTLRAAFEIIDGAEAGRRFPFLSIPAAEPVLFQPDAGIVAADAAVRALADSAAIRGVDVREGTRALALRVEGEEAAIETDDGDLRARVGVVTAGAWARPLLAGAGIDIPTTPTRETVAYFRIPEGVVPPSMVDWSNPAIYALFSPPTSWKVAEHHAGPVTAPDDEGLVSQESVSHTSAWVASRFPEADPRPHDAETCLYTNTPDEDFILERRGPIVIGSPCSGHGFKFAPAIGERLADLATPA
jgi:monomeric sarcosine oxidase